MEANKAKLTPFVNANTEWIRTNVDLPFGLSSQVGLNTKTTERMLQIGGFRHLKIKGDWEGEKSKAVPLVVGMDSNGSALAGKVQMKTVPTYEYDIDNYVGRRKQCKWGDLNLELNLAEIQQQICDGDASVRDAKTWAKEINTCLKKAIVSAGIKNLLGNMDTLDKFVSIVCYSSDVASSSDASFGSLITGTSRPHPPDAGELILQFLSTGMIFTFIDSCVNGFERRGEGRRVSLFLGPEIDRALVLGVFGTLKKLVDCY